MPFTDPSQPSPGSQSAVDRLMAAPKRLMGRRFAREVFTLQVGSFVTMGLQFVVAVTIANLLGATLYGVYFQARALLDLVSMLANLAVGQALITRLASAHSRGDEGEMRHLLAYFLKVGLTVGFVEMAIGLMAGPLLGRAVLDDPEVGYLARILFVSPLLLVAFNMVILALQSTRQVLRLTLLENGALIGISLMNVTVVALGWGVNGLLYSVALAPALTSLAALLVYRSAQARMAGMPTLAQIVRAAPGIPYRRYFAFSALVSIDKNFANLLNLLPTLLLGRLGTSAEVAYFRVGYNLMSFLSVPLTPVARNLYATLSGIYSQHGARRLGSSLLKVSLVGGGISVTSTLVMMLVSPLILMIYRPEYAAVQTVIYALGVRFALVGFGVGLGPIYQVLNRMKLAIATKIVPGIIMFGGGWVLVSNHGAVGAALTIVLAYLVGDLTNIFLVPWMLRRAIREGDQEMGRQNEGGTQGLTSPVGES